MNKEKYNNLSLLIIFCVTVLFFLILMIFSFCNINNLVNSNDSVTLLIGIFGWWILPYMLIDFFLQILVGILIFVNKNNNKVLNIIGIILETLYFLFTSIFIVPFIQLNLLGFNKIFVSLILLLFEILNITLLILVIKNSLKKEVINHERK